jgi:hypothetical protein
MARDMENAKRLKREWYFRNRELTKARAKTWAAANPEKRANILEKSRKANAEDRSAYNKEWFAKNSDKRAAYEAKRRASILQRTPKWLTEDDFWMIEQAYELAKLRTEMFGFDWHVDHIVPLQGKLVSGLHTPINIQVIEGLENCKKNAKFAVN